MVIIEPPEAGVAVMRVGPKRRPSWRWPGVAAPGYDYQSWMRAEVQALRIAIASHTSTEHL
jgi:hypothetical protein